MVVSQQLLFSPCFFFLTFFLSFFFFHQKDLFLKRKHFLNPTDTMRWHPIDDLPTHNCVHFQQHHTPIYSADRSLHMLKTSVAEHYVVRRNMPDANISALFWYVIVLNLNSWLSSHVQHSGLSLQPKSRQYQPIPYIYKRLLRWRGWLTSAKTLLQARFV